MATITSTAVLRCERGTSAFWYFMALSSRSAPVIVSLDEHHEVLSTLFGSFISERLCRWGDRSQNIRNLSATP